LNGRGILLFRGGGSLKKQQLPPPQHRVAGDLLAHFVLAPFPGGGLLELGDYGAIIDDVIVLAVKE
jgi:hypothetical protein